MNEFFKTGDIKHVKGQEGPIHNLNKAHEMAGSENRDRSLFLVREYKDYLVNPSADNPLAERFEEFQKYGVTPEYLETLAEVRAERVGDAYDTELKASSKHAVQLRWETFLADTALILSLPSLEPTQGLPPDARSINAATNFDISWSAKAAAQSELQKRYREYRKAKATSV